MYLKNPRPQFFLKKSSYVNAVEVKKMDAFADSIFKLSFLNEKADILIKMSPQWVLALNKQEVSNGLNKKGLAPGYHPNQC